MLLMVAIKQPDFPHVHQVSLSDGGVPKLAVPAAQVTVEGLTGDRQRNRKTMVDQIGQSVCIRWRSSRRCVRRAIPSVPVRLANNLTITGLDWARLKPGDRLTIGAHLHLEIMSYTAPCRLNGQWFKDGNSERMAQEAHPGWSRLYARVLVEGKMGMGIGHAA